MSQALSEQPKVSWYSDFVHKAPSWCVATTKPCIKAARKIAVEVVSCILVSGAIVVNGID